MLLALDIGNSKIAIALINENKIKKILSIPTYPLLNKEKYFESINFFIKEEKLTIEDIENIIASCVVPGLFDIFKDLANFYFNKKIIFIDRSLKSNINNESNSNEVGADLLAVAHAVAIKYPIDNYIIIDCGTATTFTYLANNHYLKGVVILSGLKIFSDSLSERIPHLPKINFENSPNNFFGHTTIESVESGIINGYKNMIKGLILQAKEEVPNAKVIMTGGFSFLFKNVKEIDFFDLNIIFEGIISLYNMNRNN